MRLQARRVPHPHVRRATMQQHLRGQVRMQALPNLRHPYRLLWIHSLPSYSTPIIKRAHRFLRLQQMRCRRFSGRRATKRLRSNMLRNVSLNTIRIVGRAARTSTQPVAQRAKPKWSSRGSTRNEAIAIRRIAAAGCAATTLKWFGRRPRTLAARASNAIVTALSVEAYGSCGCATTALRATSSGEGPTKIQAL
jgi:hypothetical protein